MQTGDPVGSFFAGVVMLFLGLKLTFRRKKVIDALTASNQVFWSKMGFPPNERRIRAIANVMLPLCGAIFLATGALSFYEVLLHFLK